MTTRLLPPAEWPPKLVGTHLDPAWQGLNQMGDRIIVTADATGHVIGCTALIQSWHLEGTWISPEYRLKASVGRSLFRAVRQLFSALHVREVYMMARTPETAAQCQRLGPALHLDCDHFLVNVQKGIH